MTKRFSYKAGDRFGRWRVIQPLTFRKAICSCECVVERAVRTDDLRAGKSKSCGCLRSESLAEANRRMPKIEKSADLVSAAATIAANVAAGELTPAEGSDLVRLVEGTARAIEVHELAERIDRLEAQMAGKGGNQ
jgi:hypothetical protein